MANRERGEVGIEIDGRRYTCCSDLDSQIAIETMFSTADREVSYFEIAAKAERGHAKYLKPVLWGLFQRHHAAEVTLDTISDLAQRAGGALNLIDLLRRAMAASAPDAKDVAELAAGAPKKRPRKAQARVNGTGGMSTSRPGASV